MHMRMYRVITHITHTHKCTQVAPRLAVGAIKSGVAVFNSRVGVQVRVGVLKTVGAIKSEVGVRVGAIAKSKVGVSWEVVCIRSKGVGQAVYLSRVGVVKSII